MSRLRAGAASPRARVEPTLTPRASLENPSSTLGSPEGWFRDWAAGGVRQEWGVPVTERTAMTCSAVFRSVALLSGIVAAMPLKVYRRVKDGREEVPDHPLARMLMTAPYAGRPMTSFVWRELWELNVLLWGNHYSIIRYNNAGRVLGFEPVMPWAVEVTRKNYRNLYRCVLEDGRVEYVDHDDMLHIPGPGFDGIQGMSRIQQAARNSISLAITLEDQAGRMIENAARPSGALEIPPGISAEGFKRMKAQFRRDLVGRHNAGEVVYLDQGAKFTPFQIPPKDLDTINARRMQVSDVSRYFGTPLHILNETDKSSSWGSGLAEINLAFLIYTIDPDLGRIEAELNYKLFAGTDLYCEFDRDTLLAMDPVKAAEVMQKETSSGVLLINEYRRKKNRPPVEGGDTPLVNSTNVPLSRQTSPAGKISN
ncbi:phage portal protein [Roseomonas sp. USHLN139]|uniref:phage portal protein n=1 Tax=Roseomonas sp. USHLN139 TaxID=3081298 RepID=UPI003B025A58